MNRTSFLVDGFNLYHSTRDAMKDLNGQSTKWLDIHSLCKSYLHNISKDARVTDIFYFSALAKHLEATDAGKVDRHRLLIRCLEDRGIEVNLAKFKRKPDYRCYHCGNSRCGHCGNRLKQYEEKETDVSIATKLLELAFTDACDTIVLITGDTDLAPAVRNAKSVANKDVRFAFPYKRHNNELENISPSSFKINKETYARHQFSDPCILSTGEEVNKPQHW